MKLTHFACAGSALALIAACASASKSDKPKFNPLSLARSVEDEPRPVRRVVASGDSKVPLVGDQEPIIRYLTFGKAGLVDEQLISAYQWHSLSEAGRALYLAKFYYANTDTEVKKGKGKIACFEGAASAVKEKFFRFNASELIQSVLTTTDEKMMGITFLIEDKDEKRQTYFFRMSHCQNGKSGVLPDDEGSQADIPDGGAEVPLPQAGSPGGGGVDGGGPNTPIIEPEPPKKTKPGVNAGFTMEDPVPADTKGLPKFKLNAEFSKMQTRESDRPWMGMDISTPQGAYAFAVAVQKYAYEGMFHAGDKNPDMNLIAQKNKERDWCHMPWLNVGVKRREWVHGLTKERDLYPSPTMPLFAKATRGSDWGVAYFNSHACKTLGRVFGDESSAKIIPDFSSQNVQFEDGAMTVKFLFTTANFPEIKDAFKWTANVSPAGDDVTRTLRTVRHIQMDIAVRDSSLKGVSKDLQDWVMVTYYFDPSFDLDADYQMMIGGKSPLRTVKNLPAAFRKMRPAGIATGFEAPIKAPPEHAQHAEFVGPSIIFKGASTNSPSGRLNGPADNPKSSCLGCHGTAGTAIRIIPGVESLSQWQANKQNNLDFSMQLKDAREHYESTPIKE